MKQNKSKVIYILDCEHYHGECKIPNYIAMKVSSYHKMMGDRVIFLSKGDHMTRLYNTCYIIKHHHGTPYPPTNLYDDDRTALMGEAFKGFDRYYEMPPKIAALRPDYTLYQDYDNVHSRSHFLQFFAGKVRLHERQNFYNLFRGNKYTYVVDDNLWDFKEEVIIEVLKELQEESNIIFLHPVKMKKLALNPRIKEEFLKLSFAVGRPINYHNNAGESYEVAVKLIDFMAEYKRNFPRLKMGTIPFKIITKDHWQDKKYAVEDFERALKIVAYAHSKKIRVNMRYPKYLNITPFYDLFLAFKTWSNHFSSKCFLEHVSWKVGKKFGVHWTEVLFNPIGTGERIRLVRNIIENKPELMLEYGTVTWGGYKKNIEELRRRVE